MLKFFLIKLQAARTATFLERDSCETCEIFKNNFFYGASPVTASDSFRFPPCIFKNEIPTKVFFCEFANFLRTSFDRTLPDDCFLSLSVNFEKFFRTYFIQQLWETTYFMYKLQYFNQRIQWKTISEVLFRDFIQEQNDLHLLKILENYLWRG